MFIHQTSIQLIYAMHLLIISQSKIICYFCVLIFLLNDSGSHLQFTNFNLVFYNACTSSLKLTGFVVLLMAKTGLISAIAGRGHGQDMEVYSIPPHVIARGKGRRESLLGRRGSFQSSQCGGGSQLEGRAG